MSDFPCYNSREADRFAEQLAELDELQEYADANGLDLVEASEQLERQRIEDERDIAAELAACRAEGF